MAAKKKEPQLSGDELCSLYKNMVFYRRFEERAGLAYTQQKFSGFLHLHIGQEAVCAGVQAVLEAEDCVISGYRSHTQAIAKGIPAKAVLAELFGRVTGCSRGKGGSMHMFSKEKRFLGGHGIVGGQAPLALGAAFAMKYKKEKGVAVCYLGDAAMNQGQVFEAMNMAATWEVPVLFIIENNRYGMGTDIRRTTSIDALHKRALAFDMKGSAVDGMDVLKVYSAVEGILSQMRKDSKPYLLEAMTYRYKGHSISDPATYRSKEEVQSYQEQDPILQLKKHILNKKHATEEDLKAWDKQAKATIKQLEAEAEADPRPEAEELFMHVLA